MRTAAPPSPATAASSWPSRSARSSSCDKFWLPLGVAMLAYYLGGILLLGNTPGVCLLAPGEAGGAHYNQPSDEPSPSSPPHPRIRLGISACLLGDEVRYDGGHKRDPFLTTVLGPHGRVGQGLPRGRGRDGHAARADPPGRRARRDPAADRQDRRRSHRVDDRLLREEGGGARRRGPLRLRPEEGLAELRDDARQGLRRARNRASASASASSRRRCSRAFRTCRSRRRDASPIRGCARTSSSAYSPTAGLRDLFETRWTVGDLVAFPYGAQARAAGAFDRRPTRASAASSPAPSRPTATRCATDYTAGSWRRWRRSRRRSATPTCCSTWSATSRRSLDAASRAELLTAIEDYRLGLVPLIVPVTLVRHHVRVHDVEYLAGQIYLGAASQRADAAQPRLSRGLIWPGNFWPPGLLIKPPPSQTIWTGV